MQRSAVHKKEPYFLAVFLLCMFFFHYYIAKNIWNTFSLFPAKAWLLISQISSPKLCIVIFFWIASLSLSLITRGIDRFSNISLWNTLAGFFTFFILLFSAFGLESNFYLYLALFLGLALSFPNIYVTIKKTKFESIKFPSNLMFWAGIAPAIYLFSFRTIDHLITAGVIKQEPIGDEKEFWYSAMAYFYEHGFIGYFQKVNGGYDPGYVFFNFSFLKTISALIPAAYYLCPILMYCMFLGLFIKKSRNMVPTAFFFWVSSFAGLFLYHDWLNALLFQIWYGEALAILSAFWFFEILKNCEIESKLKFIDVLTIFVFGATFSIVKPPMSFLFLPCALPALALTGLLLKKKTELLFHNLRCVLVGPIGKNILENSTEGSSRRNLLFLLLGRFNGFQFNWRIIDESHGVLAFQL